MKLKHCLSLILCVCALNCAAQFREDISSLFPIRKGDPRVEYRDIYTGYDVVVDKYEKWREDPATILARLGDDLDWAEDVKKAKEIGGHVVEATMKPGELAELCMLPADAEKVTHLKLSGRALKWGVYGPEELKLDVFLRSLKNLKVLNLRDLDCEIISLDRLKTVEKIVLPANCSSASITGNDKLKDVVFGPRFEALGNVVYETDKKYYETGLTRSFFNMGLMEDVEFPEGLIYIGGFRFGTKTRSVTFPSSLKLIEYFGDTFAYPPTIGQQIPALKEIHVKTVTPPVVYHFPFKYEHLKNITLYVPKGAKENYLKDLKWRNFGSIVEEDVIIKERILNDDFEIYKPITANSVIGKWKYVKSDVILDANVNKPVIDPGLDWIKLDGKVWEDCKLDGTTSKLNYFFTEKSIFVGSYQYKIEKADEKELIIYVDKIIQNVNVKFVFIFSRME